MTDPFRFDDGLDSNLALTVIRLLSSDRHEVNLFNLKLKIKSMAVTVPTTALWIFSIALAIMIVFASLVIVYKSLTTPFAIVIICLAAFCLLWTLQWNRTSTRNDM